MTKRKAITQEYLRSRLEYDPETGLWRWLERRGRRAKEWFAGAVNGNGYNSFGIRFDNRNAVYVSHRLAFLYMTGQMPVSVDHRNQIKTDNRWDNLRAASRSQNGANRHQWKKKGGLPKGVFYHPPKPRPYRPYRALIRVDGALIHLGRFSTVEEASEAYKRAAIHYHGEFACLN
jgi:HNH endonuclease